MKKKLLALAALAAVLRDYSPRAHLGVLAREREIRWATESHHCTMCAVAFGPNGECGCRS